jgi:hypothetical protein
VGNAIIILNSFSKVGVDVGNFFLPLMRSIIGRPALTSLGAFVWDRLGWCCNVAQDVLAGFCCGALGVSSICWVLRLFFFVLLLFLFWCPFCILHVC